MPTPETEIAKIIQCVECRNISLDESVLYGDPLLEEVIKLACMTLGFYESVHAGALYRPPFTEVRTKADLRQLMEFACKDWSRMCVAAFCTKALEGTTSERELAFKTVMNYIKNYDSLSRSTSWNIPTIVAVQTAVMQSVGERGSSAKKKPTPDCSPK